MPTTWFKTWRPRTPKLFTDEHTATNSSTSMLSQSPTLRLSARLTPKIQLQRKSWLSSSPSFTKRSRPKSRRWHLLLFLSQPKSLNLPRRQSQRNKLKCLIKTQLKKLLPRHPKKLATLLCRVSQRPQQDSRKTWNSWRKKPEFFTNTWRIFLSPLSRACSRSQK